jgi:hypothetical protein
MRLILGLSRATARAYQGYSHDEEAVFMLF